MARRNSFAETLARQAEEVVAPQTAASEAAVGDASGDRRFAMMEGTNVDAHLTTAALQRYVAIGGLIPPVVAREIRSMPVTQSGVEASHMPATTIVLDSCDVTKFPPGVLTNACNLPLYTPPPWIESDVLARVS